MKKLLSILLVVVLSMAAFIGCNNVTDDKNVEITLSETAITLAIGDQHALTATVTGSEESVTWASSNAAVVKVNKFGQLQVLGLGTADVTASIGSVSAKCVVTVNPVLTADVSAITLVAPVTGVELGADLISKKVSFTANPELGAGEELTIVSSNDEVAAYEEVEVAEGETEMRIVAKAVGSAVITATAPNGAKAEVAVTVEGLNANPTALTFEITTAVEVPAWCGVFLAGTLSAWGPADGYELTRIDNTTFKGTFTFDFADADKFANGDLARNAEYKFILASKADNGDGTYTYGADTGWEQVNGSNVDNRKIFVNNDETVKVDGVIFQSVPANPEKPEITNTINLTVVFTAPVEHDVYLIGPFCNWEKSEDAKFATSDNLTFTLTVTYVSKGEEFECKLNKGDWDWNYGSSDGITWTASGDNYKLPLTGDVSAENTRTVNATWNINNGSADAVEYVNSITINLTLESEEAKAATTFVLAGEQVGWVPDSTDYAFEKVDDTHYTISFSYTGKETNFVCKVTNGSWDVCWSSDDNGATWSTSVAGNASVALEGEVDGTTRTIVWNWTI